LRIGVAPIDYDLVSQLEEAVSQAIQAVLTPAEIASRISGDGYDAASSSVRPVDQALLAPLLDILQGLLKKNSSAAKSYLPELHDLLRETSLEENGRHLEASLAAFDFRGARMAVESLAASLERALPQRAEEVPC
jgi:hypothetical protein